MRKLTAIQPHDADDPAGNESVNEANQNKANLKDNEPQSDSSRSGSQAKQLKSIRDGDELIFARRDRTLSKVKIPPIPDLSPEDLEGGDLVYGDKKFDIDDYRFRSGSKLSYNL